MKKTCIALLVLIALAAGCTSYNAFERGRTAEKTKNWDTAVMEYQKALEVDPDNMRYKVYLQRARLEASRIHFDKGKSLRASAAAAKGPEQLQLAQMAAAELEITVRLDPTNQYAAIELAKAVALVNDAQLAASGASIEEIKKKAAKNNITKAQPPQLNPASDQPISLSFPHETPIKEIYKALGNAFGINILFDQAIKDSDRLAIELKDVTAQDALERVMQAANHFYKVLDEHTIIVVPDNPQARRDYEDLVIRTFYLSNGDAEQVTNVVRTMIEARNVFPLKALNAITIRDTADKVRIAEKIIEANDKAKAEVVVDVELIQLDLDNVRNFGIVASLGKNGGGAISPITPVTDSAGHTSDAALTELTLKNLSVLAHSGNWAAASIPSVSYQALKTNNTIELLANPELRISEGEKATLHIGQRIPVPVTSFPTINTGSVNGLAQQVTSYQYQDVGIKVSIEPRVHHNREVTLKLTVEVSNQGAPAAGTGADGVPAQPTFITRTIESTIRLKDGETNFLAGLIQQNDAHNDAKTPFLGDLPIIGRLFTQTNKEVTRTDLVLTMTPHIIRIPDITEDDLAPMWVGTQNNLTFRGLSPRLESRSAVDPFSRGGVAVDPNNGRVLADGEPGNYIQTPAAQPQRLLPTPSGGAPSDPFRRPAPTPPPNQPPPVPQSQLRPGAESQSQAQAQAAPAVLVADNQGSSGSGLNPRIAPQPTHLSINPGQQKIWSIVGMDLDGLSTSEITLHYDPRTIAISEVSFGPAIQVDMKTPPAVNIDGENGTVKISSSNGAPLRFNSGGDIAALRVQGVLNGETYLVLENPALKNGTGTVVAATVEGGRAKVE
jgi:general secretion pathway protein D